MVRIYADLHIHVGRTSRAAPVKITASPRLNLESIVKTAEQKGLQLVGLVDAACSGVLQDLKELVENGTLQPLEGGGCRWGQTALFFGSEVELAHRGEAAHFLAFFPSLQALKDYAGAVAPALTNPALSTQRLKMPPDEWLAAVLSAGGAALAAHAFTPHKGVYGSCVRELGEMFAQPEQISGLELGLSADSTMAASISDTHRYAYLANSDAHSPGSIGREFTVYELPELSFAAWRKALACGGEGIVALCGLDPRLGKYHRSCCPRCNLLATEEEAIFQCPNCGGDMVAGVWDRVRAISDCREEPKRRAPYKVHIPLAMLPGVGPAACQKLLGEVGTELEVLYRASPEKIRRAAGEKVTRSILALRSGSLTVQPGGGGRYGRVVLP